MSTRQGYQILRGLLAQGRSGLSHQQLNVILS